LFGELNPIEALKMKNEQFLKEKVQKQENIF